MADLMFNNTIFNIGRALINLETDVIKCALLVSAPDPAWENYAEIDSELPEAANGYLEGGEEVTPTWTADGGGDALLDLSDPLWPSITFTDVTHAVFYSDTSTDKKLINSRDFGGPLQRSNESFSIQVDELGFIKFTVI